MLYKTKGAGKNTIECILNISDSITSDTCMSMGETFTNYTWYKCIHICFNKNIFAICEAVKGSLMLTGVIVFTVLLTQLHARLYILQAPLITRK